MGRIAGNGSGWMVCRPASTPLPWTPGNPARLWAAGGDGLFRSDDDGANWQRIGQALPEPGTTVNGITVSDEAIDCHYRSRAVPKW